MRAIAEIVAALVKSVGDGQDVNLNLIKTEVRAEPSSRPAPHAGAPTRCWAQAARRHGLAKLPKLVEIINAVPEEQRAALLPQCARRTP